jgi:hypothetical protein
MWTEKERRLIINKKKCLSWIYVVFCMVIFSASFLNVLNICSVQYGWIFCIISKFECRILVFWMVTFSVLFLNVNVLNIRSVFMVAFSVLLLNVSVLNIRSGLYGCFFCVISKCKWAPLFWCTDICVSQLWAYSFVYCTEHSRVEGKNPDAHHVLVKCGWCQMCDWPQLVIIWRLEYFISYLHEMLVCRERLWGGGKTFIFIYVILSLPPLTRNALIAFLLRRSFNRTTAVFRALMLGRLCCLTQHERNVYLSRRTKSLRLLLVRSVLTVSLEVGRYWMMYSTCS